MLFNSYTWRNNFINPYESLWSLVQKFCMLNSITEAEFYTRVCGTRNSYFRKIQEVNPYYIFRLTPPLNKELSEVFKIVENDYVKLNCFSINNLGTYMRTQLSYCPICIKSGYHSVFHQLKFIDTCFIHENQPLLFADNREYILAYLSTKPYEGFDVIPNLNNIILNRVNVIDNINKNLPISIKVIDPNYRTPVITELNLKTKKLAYSLLLGDVTQEPIFEVSVHEANFQFERLVNYYTKYNYEYYLNVPDIQMKRCSYPSVYLSIYDYVRKILSNFSEKDIHRISLNLRYKNITLGEEDDKYIAFLTASAFLCSLNDTTFIRLKTIWQYDDNYVKLPYYVDLYKLENEILTHDLLKYHYIYKLIFDRIAPSVYKQIKAQFASAYTNPIHYEYKISIPQYIVTFQDNNFKIYECD